MMEYIIDYMEDKQSRSYFEMEKLYYHLSPLFAFILKKTDTKPKLRYLNLCQIPSVSLQPLPQFGEPVTRYTLSESPKIQSKIQGCIHKEGRDLVVFNTIMMCCNYDIVSDDMFDFTLVLSSVKAEDVFKTPIIIKLINHLWKKAQVCMILISLFFSILMTLFTAYIITGRRILSIEVIVIILSSIVILGETLQAYVLRSEYFRSIFNCFDVLNSSLMIVFMGMRMAESGQGIAQGWVASLAAFTGYVRWISHLRHFDSLSKSLFEIFFLTYFFIGNLIEVIISIVKDMMAFTTVLVFIFIGFSLILTEFDTTGLQYGDQLYATFKLLFANYDDSDVPSQKLFTSLIVFLLNVVLLNLLVSIMGDTYDKVQGKRIMTDSLTRLDMIREAMVYMRTLKVFRKSSQDKGYMIYCEPKDTGDDEEAGAEDEWEGRINVIKKMLKKNNQRVYELSKVTENISRKEDNVEEELKIVRKQLNLMQDKLEKSDENLKKMKKQMQDNLDENSNGMKQMQDRLTEILNEVKSQRLEVPKKDDK